MFREINGIIQFRSFDPNEYPYIKNILKKDELQDIFDGLEIAEFYVDGDTLYHFHDFVFTLLVEYFQEMCRLKCKRNNRDINGLEFYEKNRNYIKSLYSKFSGPNLIGFYKICSDLRYTFCSEFDPLWVIMLVKYLRDQKYIINNMLDMSAGRGARMMGAISLGIDYLGIDPCDCTQKGYSDILEFFKPKSIAVILKSGFEEDWKIPKEFGENTHFDFMFSSPPYFDLELYEPENKKQSTSKFDKLEIWLNKFMFVCMDKISRLLKISGLMCINIDNPIVQNTDYIKPMIRYKMKNMKFLKTIKIYSAGGYKSVHIWKKISN